MMTTYHAQVSQDDKFWLIYVPEVDRWTQARHLREVDTMARDLVQVMTGVPLESIEMAIEWTDSLA